jgi:hypothetical protein
MSALSLIGTTLGEQRRVQLNVFRGESAHSNPAVGRITSRSQGWIPSPEGYLKTWEGSKRVLAGEDLTPGNPGNNGPAAWDDKWMRNGKFFTDLFGRRRLVAQVGMSLYVVEGNEAIELFKYPQESSFDVEEIQVSIISHQNHLIFLHPDFPPLKWGGDEPVSWLGVRDIPSNPELHVCKPWGKYFESNDTWGCSTSGYYPGVFLQHDDATEPEDRGFKYMAAYQNSRGQVGRWSASSYFELTHASADPTRRQHPIVEWDRPKDQGPDFELPQHAGTKTGNGTDITHVWIARTGNCIADPDAGIFMVQGVYPYTMNRVTDSVPDAGLSLSVSIDDYPPVNASFGTVYRDTVLISGNKEDPLGVWWSKPGHMESFPPLNYYKATAEVTAVVALSDRVCVVTKETIEVIRQNDTGFFGQFRVEQRKGSKFGKSIVDIKGSLFGIFDGGFGIFDGFSYKGMADEYGELFDFISRSKADRMRAHVDTKGRYWLTLNYSDSDDESGNGLVYMYDFTLNAWFRIEEPVSCFFEEEAELYFGGKDNFRLADAGGVHQKAHVLEISPTLLEDKNPQFALIHKRIQNLYIRTASTGDYAGQVKLYSDERLVTPIGTGEWSTKLGKPGLTDVDTDSIWNTAVLDDDAQWDAPRFGWQKVKLKDPVDFYSIRIQIIVPAGGYGEISGVAMDLHIEDVQTPL